MTDWVIESLTNALNIWNEKLTEIWTIVTQSPEEFRGGSIWAVIVTIHGALQATGLALLVLFFVIGVIRTCGSFTEMKRPELGLKLFVRFIIAKAMVTYGMDLMLAVLTIVQGIINSILNSAGFAGGGNMVLPEEMITAIDSCGFWASIPLLLVALIACLLIWILSFVMILSCYGRFFKLYMYTAISPIPLSTFAGEPTQNIGKSFLKSYAGVCMEGAIVILACVIFSAFAGTPPEVDTSATAATMVWTYIGSLLLNMLILVGTVKAADRIVKEMMGL